MRLIRSAISLAFLAVFLIVGATVPIGEHTLFGHIKRIWSADETQDLVKGVKKEAGPAMERIERGVKAGVEEAKKPGADGGASEQEPAAEKPPEPAN